MNLTINITGHMTGDLEEAIDEVKRLVSQGFTSGRDDNETGGFSFSIDGPAVEYYRIRRKGKLLKDRIPSYYEASEETKEGDKIIMFDDDCYEIGEV